MCVITYIFIKCCNYIKRVDDFGSELAQAGITQAGIFTSGKPLGGISQRENPARKTPTGKSPDTDLT